MHLLVFFMISILIFIIGFISGLYVDRKFYRESSKWTPQIRAEQPHQVSLYDDVQFTANQQEQILK